MTTFAILKALFCGIGLIVVMIDRCEGQTSQPAVDPFAQARSQPAPLLPIGDVVSKVEYYRRPSVMVWRMVYRVSFIRAANCFPSGCS
jgi:hypothetical protein